MVQKSRWERRAPSPRGNQAPSSRPRAPLALLVKTALTTFLLFAAWKVLKDKVFLMMFVSAVPGRVPGPNAGSQEMLALFN